MTPFRPRTTILFVGDIFFFVFSLWLTLFLRTFSIPSRALFEEHLKPFSLLFIVWVAVFFIAGLYESRSLIFARRALSDTLLVAQAINVSIAALFFFFVPIYGIAPKTVLLIYLVVSFLLVLYWRAVLFPRLGFQVSERALVIGEGEEVDELVSTLASAHHAPATVASILRPGEASLRERIERDIASLAPRLVIADLYDRRIQGALPALYNYLYGGIRFVDVSALYEEVFGRIPLSKIDELWIARNITRSVHVLYDPLKRALDLVAALLIGLISLVFYPFIIAAIKLDDGGPAFVALPRVGEGGRTFNMYKFRSMAGYDPSGMRQLQITKVGKFLRRWRLDELPQLLNVLRGDLSFIGPRPETPALVETYEREIPYYGVRHLIRPGLSGSAQLYYHGDPHHAADVSATKMKLSYDVFYLKHRSLTLDLSIFIKTIRRILMRSNA